MVFVFDTRASSSGGAFSSGSDVVGSLEAVTLTGGATLGISNGALLLEVEAMGSLLATSNISDVDQVTILNHRGEAPMELLYCSAENPQGYSRTEWHTSVGPWPVPMFLFTLHHLIILQFP